MHDNGPQFQNLAPKIFWPSAAMYRKIFYQMGRGRRDRADHLLDEVPDKELRLLSQIELAAGLCGLPELALTTQRVQR
ncbi:MAG: hypothetical protein ACJ746_18885 [Bryobacteraceae bacterium]